MSTINNKQPINWFDNFCEASRSKFFTNDPESEVDVKLDNNLISAEECYKLITKNMKNVKRCENENDDILWKIPIILITLGCILIVLMTFSFVLQFMVANLKNSRITEHFKSDICKVEEETRNTSECGNNRCFCCGTPK